MMKYFLACCCFLPLFVCAQNLPPEMHLSPDGHQLRTGKAATTGLYDESQIRSIYLDFDPSNYWQLLTQNYQSHTDIPATMTVDGQVFDSVGVRFKGMTSYSQAQNSQKKSFNLSLDYGVDYEKWMAGAKTVVINEIMASNQSTATDEAGEFEDWIELYNTGGDAVDISGWFISDNPENLDKWAFPAGTILAPNSYLILWADEDSAQGPLHANFKLSADGESVTLFDPALQLQDEVVFTAQQEDMGLARVPNGTGDFVIQAPTFGFNNEQSSGTAEQNAAPAALHVLPNPADGSIQIILPESADQLLEIFNVFGQRVTSVSYQAGLILATTDWPSGAYVLRCGAAQRKLVVIH